MKQKIGKIRFVESYEDAPKNSFVIRQMEDKTVRLEHYSLIGCNKEVQEILHDFPAYSFYRENFKNTLIEARKLVGSNKCIYVVVPVWMHN